MPEDTSQFDRVARTYEEVVPSHIKDHYLAKRLKFILSETGSEGLALDCGCGTGSLAEALSRKGKQVIGLDNSIGMLREMLQKEVAVPVCGDSVIPPFRNSVFDLVIAVGLLHHILEEKKIEGCLREMLRVTRKGGKVIIIDPNPANPYWKFFNRKFPLDPEKERNIPTRRFLDIFSRCNVADIRYFRSGIIPDFTPTVLLPFFKRVESLLEYLPLANLFLAHQTIIVTK